MRYRKIGISLGLLLAVVSGFTCWILAQVWMFGAVTLRETCFPVLATETVGLGLTSFFGLLGIIYFWKRR